MTIRLTIAIVLAGASLTACATSEPVCRPATGGERAAFGALISHNQEYLADLMAPGAAAEQVRRLDPQIASQVFGARMGDRTVRTVLMQPPLCVVDGPEANGERVSYVFPQTRFSALQNTELAGLERGVAGADHAICRYQQVNGEWRLADACLATFLPQPAS